MIYRKPEDIPQIYRQSFYMLSEQENIPEGAGFVLRPGLVNGVEQVLICAYLQDPNDSEKVIVMPVFQGIPLDATTEIEGVVGAPLSVYNQRFTEALNEDVHRDTI